MNKRLKTATIIAVMASVASVQSVRADCTITTKTETQSAMMDKLRQSMTPDQLAAIDAMAQRKTYMSGSKCRVETGDVTMIIDPATKRITIINGKTRKYAVAPVSGASAAWTLPIMMGGMAMVRSDKPVCKVTDTGKNTEYMGHTCRHYVTDMKCTIPYMGVMTMHSDILAAMDLPGLDPAASAALDGQGSVQADQIKGIPLVTNTKITSALTGDTTMSMTATDISTDRIPESEFAVPAGYTETTQSSLFSAPVAITPGA